ncbi:hypothetical protein [Propionibacterium australiense]|uniref:Uncharacterized protein n=1 Tax=Propionibacterium australiense TaxID=119981 RepID=A0A383S6L0_9ACTN|nr:hypothetical protein [Propionibacterium australiense]RLP08967.1 hypothetical protein D9T14_07580 [Propionibacterium australiense]RLP09100.1 hypothetical protein D7U36_08170 [Propionibacterium australiense]SYZ33473.1 Hypothetical protein PROPAUS_1392 [Propionibacterium australiense]VEH91773.1 Uncharacterised protein [Propionibacterium australiense]
MPAIDALPIVDATSSRLLGKGCAFAGEPVFDAVQVRLPNGATAGLGWCCDVQFAIGRAVRGAAGAFLFS